MRDIWGYGEKIETISIDNQFNVLSIAQWPARRCRAQQTFQGSLLLLAETIKDGMTIREVEIAKDQFDCRHNIYLFFGCLFVYLVKYSSLFHYRILLHVPGGKLEGRKGIDTD